MPLTVDWATTEAHKNPVICNPDHPKYAVIVKQLDSSDTWYKSEETAQIQCQNRMLDMMPWLAMILKLNTVTKQNVDEWYFRFRFAAAHDIWSDAKVGVWDENGWTTRDVTVADFEQCIGLTANVSKRTRLQFLKGAVSNMADDMERKIEQGL